jgi:hypothetical protein
MPIFAMPAAQVAVHTGWKPGPVDKQARDGSIIKCLLIPKHLRGQHHHEIETTVDPRVRCAASDKAIWHKILRKARRPSESLA